jgi:hypothetical protein
MEREYEFFVTTDEPHQPAGAQRDTIRRLVMRNHFDMKIAGQQPNLSQHSSVSTIMAKKQLKSRFRISDIQSGELKSKSKSREREDTGAARKKSATRPKALRTRSGPTPAASPIGEETRRRSSITQARTNGSKRNKSEPILERPLLMIDPSAHRMDPFDALPIPGTPQLDALFRLCRFDFGDRFHQREQILKGKIHQLTLIVDKNTPKNNPVAIDARHTWRPFVLNDAGLLHATFASWALYAILANGFSDLMVCKLKHKNEAIRIVNCKLATSGGYISDEVVGTVLTLANLEVRPRSEEQVLARMFILMVLESHWGVRCSTTSHHRAETHGERTGRVVCFWTRRWLVAWYHMVS